MADQLSHLHPINQSLTFFLIGATGDLSRHKILKAIYTLYQDGLLPADFKLVGVARANYSHEEFHQFIKDSIQPQDGEKWNKFCQGVFFVSGDVAQPQVYEQLKAWHAAQNYCGNHLWYVATLPSLYLSIIRHLKQFKLSQTDCGWTKFMLEKPFGTDLASARMLDTELLQVFGEDQLYRIDHFLAKETVQNLLIFRFANGLFEHLWSNQFIDHIQINACEALGVTGRESFYDATGTIRDVFQNHVLQMMATVMMEAPASLSAEDIRAERKKVLNALRPLDANNLENSVAFGQYQAGTLNGENVVGYTEEDKIPADSKTETAVALRCLVDTPRWQGVPIYIRAGKRLKESVTEISIQFKEPPDALFTAAHLVEKANVLTLRIGPNEGVVVRLFVKKPGLKLELEEVPMQFCYKNTFQMDLVEAYVKLIYDGVQSDPTLFPNAEGIESAWQFVQPLLDFMAKPDFTVEPYPAGSWGPAGFDRLVAQDGRAWIQPSIEICSF